MIKRILILFIVPVVMGFVASCAKFEGASARNTQKSSTHDFVAFGSQYVGNYGLSQIIQHSITQLEHQQPPYHGVFLRSRTSDMEQMLIYDLLSRRSANLMFFLPGNYSSILNLALRYPEQKFALAYSPDLLGGHLPENLRMANIRFEQGVFLAGLVAGTMTRNNHIGMVMDLSQQNSLVVSHAFVQGVRTVNPDCDILIVSTESEESMLENETTRMISISNVDVIYAMSTNYNETILRSAYYFGDDVLLINSWYNSDNRYPKHVVASLVVSFVPLVRGFMDNAQTMANFSSLPPVRVYGLADKGVMHLSWDNQASTDFEIQRPEYRDLSLKARETAKIWTNKIREGSFVVFNTLEHGVPPVELQNFRYRDVRRFDDTP